MKVVNLKKISCKWDETVYIGRKNVTWNLPLSKWHNPFVCSDESLRAMVIIAYEDYIRKTPELWNSLEELEGKTLACWCKPKACHGDVLIKLLNEKKLSSIFQ